MSANLEDAIQEKVHSLPDEQQKQVLEFVENLEQNVRREESARLSSTAGNGKKKEVDLRARGITREQAADLRARLATFEDWNDPEMDIYDDYDQALATLNQNS
jgi:hypothetical protein